MTDQQHSFQTKPNRTLIALSIPVLLSMTAEPITALVDTAFIASLGVDALAALGVGTTALSSLFWIFNFLGISTQTEVAQFFGKGKAEETGKITSLALVLAKDMKRSSSFSTLGSAATKLSNTGVRFTGCLLTLPKCSINQLMWRSARVT